MTSGFRRCPAYELGYPFALATSIPLPEQPVTLTHGSRYKDSGIRQRVVIIRSGSRCRRRSRPHPRVLRGISGTGPCDGAGSIHDRNPQRQWVPHPRVSPEIGAYRKCPAHIQALPGRGPYHRCVKGSRHHAAGQVRPLGRKMLHSPNEEIHSG